MFPEDDPVHQFLWTIQSRVSLPVRQLYCCYPFSPLQHKLLGCRWDLWEPDSGAETDCQYSSAGWRDSFFLSHVFSSSVPPAVKLLELLRGCCSSVPEWMGVWQQHVHQHSRHTGETTLAFLFIADLYSLYFSLVVTSLFLLSLSLSLVSLSPPLSSSLSLSSLSLSLVCLSVGFSVWQKSSEQINNHHLLHWGHVWSKLLWELECNVGATYLVWWGLK